MEKWKTRKSQAETRLQRAMRWENHGENREKPGKTLRFSSVMAAKKKQGLPQPFLSCAIFSYFAEKIKRSRKDRGNPFSGAFFSMFSTVSTGGLFPGCGKFFPCAPGSVCGGKQNYAGVIHKTGDGYPHGRLPAGTQKEAEENVKRNEETLDLSLSGKIRGKKHEGGSCGVY